MKWLNRELIVGPYLTLCLSQEEFDEVSKHLKAPPSPWLVSGKGATTHTFISKDAEGGGTAPGLACVVCIGGAEGQDPIGVACLLVHEAVHVWQRFCDEIGEDKASKELEAYSIQWIAQQLMYEFKERMSPSESESPTDMVWQPGDITSGA